MTFANANRRFASTAELFNWLTTQPRPTWKPVGSTYHNTYRPTEAQWRGHASMDSMVSDTYIPKGWTSGPHFYLAVGTAFDGIYMMTPPTQRGTHAGDCNSGRFGVEVVGDFEERSMSLAQLTLLIDTLAVLHRWAGIGANVVAHRDCMPGRTCPGQKAYEQKDLIKRALEIKLRPATPDYNALWGRVATPNAESWNWPLPMTWKRNYQQLGRCVEEADYRCGKQVITQYFENGSIQCVGDRCQIHMYPAPIDTSGL